MARLPYLDKEDLKPEDQELLARGINLQKILVHSPGATRAHGAMGQYIRYGSTMDARLREMAILQGLVGEEPLRVVAPRQDRLRFRRLRGRHPEAHCGECRHDTGLAPIDKAVLRAAREITLDGKVADDTYAALADHFSNEHLIDLLVTMAFYNAVVRFLASTEMDVEESYQPYLDQFPLAGLTDPHRKEPISC